MPLTAEQFRKRHRELVDQERKNEPGWYYISFVGDDGFLGACIVQGQGVATALDRSHRLHINPGGEAAIWELPPGAVERIPPKMRDRLLSKAEALSLGKVEV